jgi:NADP-dependent aldehyde dehydrogenase
LVQQSNTSAVGLEVLFPVAEHYMIMLLFHPNPFLFFQKMGSTNPVLLLPDALSLNAETIATQYAGSITLGVGQFCTNPGILIGVSSEGLEKFKDALANAIVKIAASKMLHKGYYKLMKLIVQKHCKQTALQHCLPKFALLKIVPHRS